MSRKNVMSKSRDEIRDEGGKRGNGKEVRKRKKRQASRKGRVEKIDEKLFREAFERATRQPRLAFYSPIASCVLNYWKSAVPRFSISEFLAKLVEKEISEAWPKLYERAAKKLKRSIRKRAR